MKNAAFLQPDDNDLVTTGRRLFVELSDLVAGRFYLLSPQFKTKFKGLTLYDQPEQFCNVLQEEIWNVRLKLGGGAN